MSIVTFRKALKYADEVLTIGGGEPTIHPLFWQMMGEAIGRSEYVWLATNGKKTVTALALAKLAKRGIIGCALSRDEYHEPVAQEVVAAFTREKRNGVGGYYETHNDHDQREIRCVSAHEINAGRCDFGNDGCICEDLFCKPDGTICVCGCEDSPILGTVDHFDYPENTGGCYKHKS